MRDLNPTAGRRGVLRTVDTYAPAILYVTELRYTHASENCVRTGHASSLRPSLSLTRENVTIYGPEPERSHLRSAYLRELALSDSRQYCRIYPKRQ